VTIRNGALAVSSFSDHSWVRKWVSCSLKRWPVPGRLTSNNGCSYDAYMVGQEMWRGTKSSGYVGWLNPGWIFTDSAGFGSIGSFPCKRQRASYVCRNAVGDAFKFTP
jgi:hypothetical protein